MMTYNDRRGDRPAEKTRMLPLIIIRPAVLLLLSVNDAMKMKNLVGVPVKDHRIISLKVYEWIRKYEVQVEYFLLFTRDAYDEEERDNDEGVDTIGGDPVLFPI